MGKAGIITIDHLEVKKSDIDKVKKVFKVKDNAEAVKRAIDVVVGNIDVKGNKTSPKAVNALCDIDDIAVETGIRDLAKQHDHYLYGVTKK
jgi:hypothetical protein